LDTREETMSITTETNGRSIDVETPATSGQIGERNGPPTRLLQILKALEVEAASDVQAILRRSRATFR
jgi:hypothetical protein